MLRVAGVCSLVMWWHWWLWHVAVWLLGSAVQRQWYLCCKLFWGLYEG